MNTNRGPEDKEDDGCPCSADYDDEAETQGDYNPNSTSME